MPFGLEEQISSNGIVFNERSLLSALAPDYGTGVVVAANGSPIRDIPISFAAGLYAAPFGDAENDRHGSEHLGFAARFTAAPLAEARAVFHAGLSLDHRSLRGAHEWEASRRPETQLAPSLLEAELTQVARVTSIGAEIAAQRGPLLLQAELARAHAKRTRRSTFRAARFDGAVVQIASVVTGEQRAYEPSGGTFESIEPARRWGALELGVRWSMLDLDDADERGGRARDVTLGAS